MRKNSQHPAPYAAIYLSSLHGVLFLSVAMSTSERQCSQDAPFFRAFMKDRCSALSLIPFNGSERCTCGWVFLEVVSSLMEACESQQQLHGDGLRQEHCVRCGQQISSVVPLPCRKAGTLILPRLPPLSLYDERMGILAIL